MNRGSIRSGGAGFFIFLRYLWASPCSIFGFLLAFLSLSGRSMRVHLGVLEIRGTPRAFLFRLFPGIESIAAVTFGHVVIGGSEAWLRWSMPHERVHVRQYEQWGVFFFPAYLFSSLWVLLRGGHPYRDNWFERMAVKEVTLPPPVKGTSLAGRDGQGF